MVDWVADGLDGLHLALTEAHDLAILDVLPGLDGWRVLQVFAEPARICPYSF